MEHLTPRYFAFFHAASPVRDPCHVSLCVPARTGVQVFGIIGIQLWAGVMRGECGYAGSGIPCARPCDNALCQPAYGDSCPAGYAEHTAARVPWAP